MKSELCISFKKGAKNGSAAVSKTPKAALSAFADAIFECGAMAQKKRKSKNENSKKLTKT